jgi:hypothetical protein
MSLTNDLPFANREMILGSGPMSRSSGPAESGPGRPPPREARGAAKGAQAVSTLWLAARQCQFPPRQFHDWLTGRQCTALRAIEVQQKGQLAASPPLSIPIRARTSALGGYVTGHGVGLGRGAVRQ